MCLGHVTPHPSAGPRAARTMLLSACRRRGLLSSQEAGGGAGLTATVGRASPVYVPAEEVVLHQHVLNTFLQWLLLLLHTRTVPVTGAQQGR